MEDGGYVFTRVGSNDVDETPSAVNTDVVAVAHMADFLQAQNLEAMLSRRRLSANDYVIFEEGTGNSEMDLRVAVRNSYLDQLRRGREAFPAESSSDGSSKPWPQEEGANLFLQVTPASPMGVDWPPLEAALRRSMDAELAGIVSVEKRSSFVVQGHVAHTRPPGQVPRPQGLDNERNEIQEPILRSPQPSACG